MGAHRQRFLHDLTTLETVLRGIAGVDSYHCVPSSFSLFTQDIEKRAPGSVHDAFCQGMVLYHVENGQLLNGDHLIAFSILLGRLIVEVAPLPLDLEMGLCRTTGGEASAMTAFLASG